VEEDEQALRLARSRADHVREVLSCHGHERNVPRG
jgi:hypothetical protein